MGVRIDRISVESLGPVRRFNRELGSLNLIYSKNEGGKTFLVEFLIRSLFRNTGRWDLRQFNANGKILVSGLESQPVEFHPSSKMKLEDYLEKQHPGLPPRFVNLLLAKGADAAIADVKGGIDRYVIKSLLSSKEILDKIDGKIKKTVQGAQIAGHTVEGRNDGEIKTYRQLEETLRSIDNLIDEIDMVYSGGPRQQLALAEQAKQDQLEQLDQARRHQAYQTAEARKELEKQKTSLPEDKIEKTSSEIFSFKKQRDEFEKLQEKYLNYRQKSRDFHWLQQAQETYNRLSGQRHGRPSVVFFIIAILLAVGSMAGILFFKPITGIVGIALSVGLLAFYIYKYKKFAEHVLQNEELRILGEEFQKRTGGELTGVNLNAALDQSRKDHEQCEFYQREMDRKEEELHTQHATIREQLRQLAGRVVEDQNWESVVEKLKNKLRGIENNIREKELELTRLGVEETDYLVEHPGISFDHKTYQAVRDELEEIRSEKNRAESELNNLKARISQATGLEQSLSWEDLIEALQEKRLNIQQQCRDICAQIVGQNAVHRVIEALREQEDRDIENAFADSDIQSPLWELTKRYHRIRLTDDSILVSDDYHNFPLSDVSTGVQEQIMLALRIGFSSRLLKKGSLFLILDDAFQHSDWDRRPLLIDRLFELVRQNWQIIYFSMDDHIKGLFENKGAVLHSAFKSIEIGIDD